SWGFHMDRIRSLSRFPVLMAVSCGLDSFGFHLSCPHGSFMRTGFIIFPAFLSSWGFHMDRIRSLSRFPVLMAASYGQDSFSFPLSCPHASVGV
ncbi:hypothetical protein ACFOYZ_29720, partial [Neobacillus cucumis]|uniref:hypothetical protein n=2 Tax=Neobacillus cucumis TaxID=1740721 RepID=UPI003614E3B8